MAVEVEMSQDIRKYEAKAVGPFSIRQVVCIGGFGALGALFAIALPLETTDKIFVFILFMIPGFLCGTIKVAGMPFEMMIIRILYQKLLVPKKRKVIRTNYYQNEVNKIRKRKEKRKMAQMTSEQRKRYENKKVTYSQKRQYRIFT